MNNLKIAVWGIKLPLGKRSLEDERLKVLSEILRAQKTTPIYIELLDSSRLKDSDALILNRDLKQDLILTDLERIEELILKEKPFKDLLLRLKEILEKEKLLSEENFSPQEEKNILSFNLLTYKPCCFMEEKDISDLSQKIKELYYRSKRICFFTANERELRSWQIFQQTTAYAASGLIHSDIQRGFIKAEVIGYQALTQAGNINQAKAKGLVRLEDKNYIIQDGDLIYFRFNA